MWPNPLYSACLRRAAELLGGFEPLAARLQVPARTLERWANELGAPTERQFLELVDILEVEDAKRPATPAIPAQDVNPAAPPPPIAAP